MKSRCLHLPDDTGFIGPQGVTMGPIGGLSQGVRFNVLSIRILDHLVLDSRGNMDHGATPLAVVGIEEIDDGRSVEIDVKAPFAVVHTWSLISSLGGTVFGIVTGIVTHVDPIPLFVM